MARTRRLLGRSIPARTSSRAEGAGAAAPSLLSSVVVVVVVDSSFISTVSFEDEELMVVMTVGGPSLVQYQREREHKEVREVEGDRTTTSARE